ncbi:M16 family metallopeptidase [Novosphingobium sp.]|uniref:M16 family metallopeptidase n=1 Tax=Novosphingobium sp. TaxID=1874826 RepID=UPI003B51E581
MRNIEKAAGPRIKSGATHGVRFALVALATALLAGCATENTRLIAPAPKPVWPMASSDIAPDPGYRFGRLANGVRTIVRSNATPAGTAMVRMVIDTGSLDERDDQRGLAHFVEHMAFEGSTHLPDGDMIKVLQRAGLAFGADTNASTSFERTIYQLDLPRADPTLLNTALMLMRETASELRFTPDAVNRERGVVLSELREGKGFTLTDWHDMAQFLYPKATYIQRLPIGTEHSIMQADAAALRAFWQAHYRPDRTTVVVIGDFPAAKMDAAIKAHFGDWQPNPAPPPGRIDAGRVDRNRHDRVDIWTDPALSERVTASRHGPWTDEPDTIANRRRALLRNIGYRIVNRRFQSLSRRADPPFHGAGFGTADVFHAGRTTNLVVDTEDGKWRRGLITASAALRQALTRGFTRAELDEQIAELREGLENAAAEAQTRSNAALLRTALAAVTDDKVPATPADALARFNAFMPTITPAAVLEALRADALPLDAPLLRFQGRHAPKGGAADVRRAWAEGETAPGAVFTPVAGPFGYGDVGSPGAIVSDQRDPVLGIRMIRFANGVRLNLKHTDLDRARVRISLSLAGGLPLATRADPQAVTMVSFMAAGGLRKHSADDLQTLLAGHSVGGSLTAVGDAFVAAAEITPRDLALECAYLAAMVRDPGYRPEAELAFHEGIANVIVRRDATPHAALANALGRIESDGDPRFTLADIATYRALNFAKLRGVIGDRLAHGAIEIGMVGDFDEATAIADIARTFAALPVREADFHVDPAAVQRKFTDRRGPLIVTHKGPAAQAIVRFEWPTTDDHDEKLELTLDMIQAMVTIAVEDTLRETMGKTYSPRASSSQSDLWPGWGTFAVQASVTTADVDATRAAIRKTIAALIAAPADPDLIARARAPLVERIDNGLKGNAGWLALVARAQTRPDRIVRHEAARDILLSLTAGDMQAAAARYLQPDRALEILVVPAGAKVAQKAGS